jgi:DNA-binding response OmpR family regulator
MVGITVLVAEDYQSTRMVTVEIVRRISCVSVVIEAGDGNEALEALLEHNPAITLLDTQMPFLAGYEVVREYRIRNPKGKTTFVMMSCFPEHYENVAKGLGAYFIKKPYDINVLRDRIISLAERIARANTE